MAQKIGHSDFGSLAQRAALLAGGRSHRSHFAASQELSFLSVMSRGEATVRVDVAHSEPDLFPLATRAAIILGSCAVFWISLGALIF